MQKFTDCLVKAEADVVVVVRWCVYSAGPVSSWMNKYPWNTKCLLGSVSQCQHKFWIVKASHYSITVAALALQPKISIILSSLLLWGLYPTIMPTWSQYRTHVPKRDP